ncbi:hypothetical protein A0H81_09037 [Grifola frondosa]|uniref:RanBD1 domain-containing protein n=1 Tax=Grifola frondosa TaxID=5627 RepID=A0A1C7M2D8_GRIFR|nr:hypothetical protein A0H81_09037 [Grifola frondosa]
MKRGAERQLTKDDDDNEIEELSPDQGFQKADEVVLARRPMKALPRRSQPVSRAETPPSGSSAPSVPAPPSPAKFSGFSGFTGSSAGSAPFAFGTPAASSKPFSPTVSTMPSSSSPFTGTSSAFAPAVSASASPATKAFASLVGSSSPSVTLAPQAVVDSIPSATTSDTSPPGPSEEDGVAEEIKYLMALRGLNLSFLSAVSKAIESDPFIDVAELLERYKSFRVSAKSDYDEKLGSTKSSSSESRSVPGSTKASTSAPSSAPVSMPPAPSSFAGFKPPVVSSPPASNGFGKAASTSSFSFGSSKPADKSDSNSATLSSPFAFGSHKPAEKSDSGSTTSSTPFTFGSSKFAEKSELSTAPSSSPFGTGFQKFAPAGSSAPKSAFAFGTSSTSSSFSFGTPPATSASKPSTATLFSTPSTNSPFGLFTKSADKDKDQEQEDKGKDKDSGSASTSIFGTTTSFGTPEKPTSSAFSFGSASPSKSPSLGFGKAGTIGNPVGFGFGSPPQTPEDGPSKSSAFTLAAPPKLALTPSEEKIDAESTSGEGTPAPEGEVKSEDGKPKWGDLGVGVLRVKKNKETGMRRLLLRNSSTGKITINFNVHAGMNTSLSEKVVSFMGHEEGRSTPYMIRTKTTDQASALKQALDREIEFVHLTSLAYT